MLKFSRKISWSFIIYLNGKVCVNIYCKTFIIIYELYTLQKLFTKKRKDLYTAIYFTRLSSVGERKSIRELCFFQPHKIANNILDEQYFLWYTIFYFREKQLFILLFFNSISYYNWRFGKVFVKLGLNFVLSKKQKKYKTENK